ncbi:MAG: response regulator transcription factor [Candidatus Marinimicrobia bacterium]|nr:response regulator transcription factor [Candidatus Neomarinimicrobiota bacterium]MDP6852969.1 response regulator transcription factor [Candidatus Neomarinimicrobiota bacterium]
MENILIIDDDIQLTELLIEFLGSYKYNVQAKHTPEEGLEYIKSNNEVNAIILDIMLPGMDGFQVLRKIRENLSIPVIMLTARGEVTDKIVGLELGADDYLSKPFEPRELLARIQSILRRTHSPAGIVEFVEFKDLTIDKIKQEVCLDGEVISLSTTEYEALLLFVENAGESLDREFLVENLRGISWQSYDRSVDVLVSRLRGKLGETPSKTRFIKTIHGVGYKFIGESKD